MGRMSPERMDKTLVQLQHIVAEPLCLTRKRPNGLSKR